jgi:DNA-binding NtrC family response regulator
MPGRTHPEGPTSSVSPPAWELYVVSPPELAGRVIDLPPGLTIGREEALNNNDGAGSVATAPFAQLAHPTVSRRHCAIHGPPGLPILTELGSRNGTKVNGIPLTNPQALAPQSVVRLGSVLGVVDEQSPQGPPPTPALPGTTPAMVRARDAFERAVASAAPVVVLGDTGTGKERVAAEIHRRSKRNGPYVKFSCAELARDLVESQLFGHERGAFTGAATSQPGLFAAADQGTLFLDELGELPLDLQAKLLRVLQEGEVRPLGSLTTRPVNVRVVAATNRDLRADVERGAFRRDLYARLSFFEIRLPPLRARRQDLLWWIQILCSNFAVAHAAPRAELTIHPDAAELLLLHGWPENLRGLDRFVHGVLSAGESVVGRRVLAALMPEITSDSSPPLGDTVPAGSDPPAFERPSRAEFMGIYEATGRNVRATSKHFGKDRRQIYRWLEQFGIPR